VSPYSFTTASSTCLPRNLPCLVFESSNTFLIFFRISILLHILHIRLSFIPHCPFIIYATIIVSKITVCPREIGTGGTDVTSNHDNETLCTVAGDRTLRPRQDRNYAVPDSDDENMEEDPEGIQQGHLCTSADPRRIGREEEKPSFSTQASCVKPLPPSKPQTIKQHGSQQPKLDSRSQGTRRNLSTAKMHKWGDPRTVSPLGNIHIHRIHTSRARVYRTITLFTGASSHRPGERMVTKAHHRSLGGPHRFLTIASTCTLMGTRSTSADGTPPARITDSNTRITLREGSLKEPLPTSESALGWVQLQQKSLRCEEHIQGSSIMTHEGLTNLAHPQPGIGGEWN
jgi:hypothetical protein